MTIYLTGVLIALITGLILFSYLEIRDEHKLTLRTIFLAFVFSFMSWVILAFYVGITVTEFRLMDWVIWRKR